MRLICVGGAWSASGKTSVVELLLRAFPGWAAIKVTPSRPEEVCPLGTCCGACQAPEGPYEVITEPAILAETGKDTARFQAAGASEVAWIRALPEALPTALEVALAGWVDPPGVIVESTTLLPAVSGLRLVVAPAHMPRAKESTGRCAGHVDLLALNRFGAEEAPVAHPLKARLRAPVALALRADGAVEDPVNAPFIAYCREQVALMRPEGGPFR
ncbi:MAG TPA: hypothetical protein V6D05_00590 [Stenomitos sp.]